MDVAVGANGRAIDMLWIHVRLAVAMEGVQILRAVLPAPVAQRVYDYYHREEPPCASSREAPEEEN